jgi:hypothetical protein
MATGRTSTWRTATRESSAVNSSEEADAMLDLMDDVVEDNEVRADEEELLSLDQEHDGGHDSFFFIM